MIVFIKIQQRNPTMEFHFFDQNLMEPLLRNLRFSLSNLTMG